MQIRMIPGVMFFTSLLCATPTTCPPNFTTDSIPVTASCPGLIGNNFQILIEPSTGIIAGNDNTPAEGQLADLAFGDGDFNDIWIHYQISTSPDPGVDVITFQYEGALSARVDTIEVNGVPVNAATPSGMTTAPVGGDLPLQLYTSGQGYDDLYLGSNDQATNTENAIPFWGTQVLDPVPEPGGLALVGMGLVGLGWMGRRKGKQRV